MFATIVIPLDPTAFHLGPIAVHWYGIGYAVAFVVGMRLAGPHAVRNGISQKDVNDVSFWTILAGLVGARLYFVVQSGLPYYLHHPQYILAIWQGGMAFFGAIFAAVATLLFLSWRRRLNFWVLFDAGVLFAAIGQPIGRLGNLANGDILGPPSNLPWATEYTNPHTLAPQTGVPYQPAAAYEALGTLCILGILLLMRRRGVPEGWLGIAYLVLYPVSQLLLFTFRSTEPALWLGLKQAQWTSLAVLLIGVPMAVFAWSRSHRALSIRRADAPAA